MSPSFRNTSVAGIDPDPIIIVVVSEDGVRSIMSAAKTGLYMIIGRVVRSSGKLVAVGALKSDQMQ
jgi:hypothetical protein